MNFDSSDIDTYARTLWAEARGEPKVGQLATGWVILNRANRAAYAGSLAGEVGAIRKVCLAPLQFSCWNTGGFESQRARLLSLPFAEFEAQHALAVDILSGADPDPTGGADCYFTVAQPPDVDSWPPIWAASMRHCGVFGSQIFFDSRHTDDHRVLYLGTHGDDVKAIQKALAIPDTGEFDAETRNAVIAYQSTAGLTADGVVGRKTHAALNA